MNLIILTETDQIDEHRYSLNDHRAEHIRSILKLSIGDTVETGLLNGPCGHARIEAINDGMIVLVWEETTESFLSTPSVDLICALPRPQTLKKILITSAMMGVRSLHLIRANRVEKSFFQSPLIQPDNQLPYLLEGLSQGKSTQLPEVHVHNRFRRFIEDRLNELDNGTDGASLRLLCNTEATASLDDVFDSNADCVTIAIGPEGGWVPFEIELMQNHRFQPFSLGRWTLRVEHAVTAALSQLELLASMQKD